MGAFPCKDVLHGNAPMFFYVCVCPAHEADGEALFCAPRVKYQALMSNAKPIAPQT